MAAVRNNVLGSTVFLLCLLALQGFPEVFEFDRQQVLSGEIWRIWTAHLVHTNVLHMCLNIAAALVIYFGFFNKIEPGQLLAYGCLFSALISLALLLFLPGLDWYNGLSGLLHAWVACFSVRLAMNGARVYWLWLGAIGLKVVAETAGMNPGNGNLIGDMNIVTEAHLIGACIGTAVGFIGIALGRGIGHSPSRHKQVL